MNAPFFSVIMPVYNRSSFLNKSILSVLSQDFPDFELICVDDGSTDNSIEIIKQFSAKDNRVKLIRHDKNLGRCAARNSGIKAAAARWVCFLDSDDIYLPNHLSHLHRLISDFPGKNAFAASLKSDSDPAPGKVKKNHEKISIVKLKDVIYSNPLSPNILCYNKEKIKITFADENIPVSEDWLFMRSLLLETDVVKTTVITSVFSEHEQRSMNVLGTKDVAYWNEYTGLLFSTNPKLTKSMSNLVKSYTYLLCANMLISGTRKNDSVPVFKKSLHFSTTFFNPLFYKYLIKYLFQ
jgi:glycosyltransferase involved in cell wall biosynthesis